MSGLSSFSLAYRVFSPISTYKSEAKFYHFQYYQPPEVPTNTLVQCKLSSMQQMGVVHTCCQGEHNSCNFHVSLGVLEFWQSDSGPITVWGEIFLLCNYDSAVIVKNQAVSFLHLTNDLWAEIFGLKLSGKSL